MSKNKDKEISLDALLVEQSITVTLATVEAIPDKPDLVRVTPWIPARGCACRFALDVPKRDIGKLTRTEHRHFCCGKVLSVVEIEFKDESVLSVTSVFADLSRRAASTPPPPQKGSRRPRRWPPRRSRFTHRPIPIMWPNEPVGDDGWGGSWGGGVDDGWGGDPFNGVGDPGSDSACVQECLGQFAQYGPTNLEQLQFCRQYCSDPSDDST
jgi:hypothetical protein